MIGADCQIRENVTMNIGTEDGGGVTEVGERGFFMAYSHVGHDCRVGNDVVFANCATLGGHCAVGEHVFIGGLSAAHQFTRIGDHAMISGLSGLRGDVIPFGIAAGAFARLSGVNVVGMKRRKFSSKRSARFAPPTACCSSARASWSDASRPWKRASARRKPSRRSLRSFALHAIGRCALRAAITRADTRRVSGNAVHAAILAGPPCLRRSAPIILFTFATTCHELAGGSSVANLTFLPALPRVRRSNVKSKATLENHGVLVPLLVPTFVRARAAREYER